MRSKFLQGVKICAAVLCAVTAFSFPRAAALEGDGRSFVDCGSGRYTIAYRAWGKAQMWVYGCRNGYVFVNINSSTTNAKGAGIIRHKSYGERYVSTTGYSKYATQTPMLRYISGSCYTAQGWSMDSNYGATQTIKWCI